MRFARMFQVAQHAQPMRLGITRHAAEQQASAGWQVRLGFSHIGISHARSQRGDELAGTICRSQNPISSRSSAVTGGSTIRLRMLPPAPSGMISRIKMNKLYCWT